jgi:protein-L-isoaspartate(D-aspartate) O-methyltransferase
LQKESSKAIITAMDEKPTQEPFALERQHMLQQDLKGRDITDPKVLEVMAEIRRENFVDPKNRTEAYRDSPLPIGLGQTIAQPYIVALMTQELRIGPDCKVLEIGTGSGYQTAILSRLARKVYTIERLDVLGEAARSVLTGLDISNVEYHVGDGSCGWFEQKTFDRIIVTASVPTVPQPLIEQLGDGGLMVVPVGSGMIQELMVYEKAAGMIREKVVCGCRFVKLIGKYSFGEK